MFVDTWMDGGIGRAQGGYDEMVFRAMVRDGATFYDPLGLVSEGTKIDFQLQINSYLYGTRFMTWLADRYSPGEAGGVDRRASRAAAAYYATQFKQVFGRSIEDAWARVDRVREGVPAEEPRGDPQVPDDALHGRLAARARARSRAPIYDERAGKIYAALQLSRRGRRTSAPSTSRRGSVERLVDIKGPIIYTVTSLAWDPDSRTTLLHHRQRRLPRPGRARPGDGPHAPAAEGRADRRPRLQPGRQVAVGHPPPERPVPRWCGSRRRTPSWNAGPHVPLRRDPLRPRRLAGRHARCRPRSARSTATRACACSTSAGLLKGDMTPVAEFDFGSRRCRTTSCSRRTAGTCTAARTSPACRTSSATRLATRKLDAVTNAETGFFRPIPLGGDELIVFRYTGQGFVPTRIDGEAARGRRAHHVPRHDRSSRSHPVLKDWNIGHRAAGPVRHADEAQRQLRPRRRPRCSNRCTRSCRATRTRRPSASA